MGTQLGGALRRPSAGRTSANKERATSYAAYRTLSDVLPNDAESVYKPLMKELGYDPEDNSTDIETPTGISNVTGAAMLEFRHHEKANQLGDLAPGGHSDWSEYAPQNAPGTVFARTIALVPLKDPDHCQPLT